MDFLSDRMYVDVCLDYALAYSEGELSAAFTRTVSRIAHRPENSALLGSPPVYVDMTHGEILESPTDIKGGLHFFFQKLTPEWPQTTFADYFAKVRADMIKCYVPFRSFSDESFRDSMRLRVYQDAMNIIAGRTLDGSTARRYSRTQKLVSRMRSREQPAL